LSLSARARACLGGGAGAVGCDRARSVWVGVGRERRGCG